MKPTSDELTSILASAAAGQRGGTEKLFPLVYSELRELAAAKLARQPPGQTLQPTALVHEAWLRLVGAEQQTWDNRGHFFAAAAEAMRRILIENARRKSRLKRWGGQQRVEISDVELTDTTADDKVLLINEALEKLQAEQPDLARVVTLRFFGGLTNKEVAESLGVSERTVERDWSFAKAWMYRVIKRELL